MAPRPAISAAGVALGTLYAISGVGGSSFATPVLGLLGVPGLVAIAAPLPATVPAAIAGATADARRREVDGQLARWSIVGGVPGTVAGACSRRWSAAGRSSSPRASCVR